MENRRKFLQNIIAAAGMLYTSSTWAKTTVSKKNHLLNASRISLHKNDVLLFQGDSITDVGRNREVKEPNIADGMGKGYPFLAAAKLLREYADKDVKIYNRGISGHKVPQLADRWQEDCLDLHPQILSILIGINDYWHKRDGHYDGNSQSFKAQYRQLLESTMTNLPEIKIIIGEPFTVKEVKHVTESWFPEVEEYQLATRELANEFNLLFIPYQKVFDEACKVADGGYWTTDGIHPTLAGADLMAEAWLQMIKK